MGNRKTFNVAEFRIKANHWLRQPTLSQLEKSGIAYAIEHVLHKTGNYRGFITTYNPTQLTYEEQKKREWDRQYL